MGDKRILMIAGGIGVTVLVLVIGMAIGSARARVSGDPFAGMNPSVKMQQNRAGGIPTHIQSGTLQYMQSRNLHQPIQNANPVAMNMPMQPNMMSNQPMQTNPAQQQQMLLQNLQAQQRLMQQNTNAMPNMMSPMQPNPQSMMMANPNLAPQQSLTRRSGQQGSRPLLIREFGIEVKSLGSGQAVVSGVMGNSKGAKAGLKRNDIILRFNKKRVTQGPQGLQSMVRMVRNERTYPMVIMRQGDIQTVQIKVGEGELNNVRPITPPVRRKLAPAPMAFANPNNIQMQAQFQCPQCSNKAMGPMGQTPQCQQCGANMQRIR
ncbi:MAG: hypothetical protein ACI9Y8_000203 [Candidatus Omnitrophota bacterium]|jgi:hypothetical protein